MIQRFLDSFFEVFNPEYLGWMLAYLLIIGIPAAIITVFFILMAVVR